MLSENQGWLWLGNRLYATGTGGEDWQDISPTTGIDIETVFFLDDQIGWVLLGQQSEAGVTADYLALTSDGGENWLIEPLSLPADDNDHPPVSTYSIGFLDADFGWISARYANSSNFSQGVLYVTQDGGEQWELRSLPIGEAVTFHSPEIAWTAGGANGDQLFRTEDGGNSWNTQELTSLGSLSVDHTYYQLPVFNNRGQGKMAVVRVLDDQTELELFSSQDSGLTWQIQTSLPIDSSVDSAGEIPVDLVPEQGWVVLGRKPQQIFQVNKQAEIERLPGRSNLFTGINKLDMLTLTNGWASYADGRCESLEGSQDRVDQNIVRQRHCTQSRGLLKTTDGGRTWTALSLPGMMSQNDGLVTQHQTYSYSLQEESTAGSLAVSYTTALSGQGFDKCEIPSLSKFRTWTAFSPYQTVNLYIGGSMRACSNTALTAALVVQLEQMGWTFIPTWVGPQASCSAFSDKMSTNTTTAYNQGVSEANLAITAADNLGLTDSSGSGTVIYYDLEYYNTSNTTCNEAAKAFISGWTYQMRLRGNLAGVYSNGPPLNAFSTITNVPDVIWPAHWIYDTYDADATVWNVYSLSNGLWANNQRIRQYAGGHTESWGNDPLTIDSDVIDGIVSRRLPIQTYFPIIFR